MRLILTCLAVAVLLFHPAALLAGDKVHHGHGMRSGWDSQTGSGFQGSEYIGEIPDFYRVDPRRHHNYGHGYPWSGYGYSGLNVTYNNGNLGASFNYSRRTTPYYGNPAYYAPVCGNYAPAQYYASPYAFQQPALVYSAPNYQRYPAAPIWSAAPNPQFGYPAQPAQSYQQQQQPQIVNIYNYYGEEFSQQQAQASPPPAAPGYQAPPEQRNAQPVQREARENPVGTKFHSSVQLVTPGGSMLFYLDRGVLSAGPENGPSQEVATGVDDALGVLAAWQPGAGYCLIYRAGDTITACFNNGGGWMEEPLPEFADFSKDVTIGMVGGSPWVVFSGFDGSRLVYSYNRGWQKLGSATQSAAEE